MLHSTGVWRVEWERGCVERLGVGSMYGVSIWSEGEMGERICGEIGSGQYVW